VARPALVNDAEARERLQIAHRQGRLGRKVRPARHPQYIGGFDRQTAPGAVHCPRPL
jgi:hypothetical protein